MAYQMKEYWERRLSADFSLSSTGHQGFSERYNRYLYKLKERSLGRALRRYDIKVERQSVLDIGCGNGFFVDYYARKGAVVTGVDITDMSVRSLSAKFPSCRFFKADISAPDLGLEGSFDIVNIFDLFYHIVDDGAFERAIGNIGGLCKRGAWILLTDTLAPEKSVGEHVRYRGLETYRTALGKAGIDIAGIVPVFRLMGRGVGPAVRNEMIRRALGRAIESLAPFCYIIDLAYCPEKSSLMRLLVCRKK